MQSYECAIVWQPAMADDALKGGVDKYAKVIDDQGGEITRVETWGKRKLAYEINDRTEGYYYFYKFRGTEDSLNELNRQLRIDEEVLRHLIVVDEFAEGNEAKIEAANIVPVAGKEREREDSRAEVEKR